MIYIFIQYLYPRIRGQPLNLCFGGLCILKLVVYHKQTRPLGCAQGAFVHDPFIFAKF